jgi:hypothetical protein
MGETNRAGNRQVKKIFVAPESRSADFYRVIARAYQTGSFSGTKFSATPLMQ